MVKIRYAELPAGLHVVTEAADRCTIVYLKPGLTRAQRKDALLVARRSARFGDGPSLPTLDMAFALAADRMRTTARMTGWAMRKHPLLMLPLLALIAGIIVSGILATAVLVSATPRVSSAHDSAHFGYQLNPGQLAGPQPGSSAGPATGTPVTGSPAPADGQGQPTQPADGNHSGTSRTRRHPAAAACAAAACSAAAEHAAPGGPGQAKPWLGAAG